MNAEITMLLLPPYPWRHLKKVFFMSFNDLYAAKSASGQSAPSDNSLKAGPTAAEPSQQPKPAPTEKAPSDAPAAPKS